MAENFERGFAWQEGYAIFPVSNTHVPAVSGYIANQEARHGKSSFVDELRQLLERNGVEYDPRYLF